MTGKPGADVPVVVGEVVPARASWGDAVLEGTRPVNVVFGSGPGVGVLGFSADPRVVRAAPAVEQRLRLSDFLDSARVAVTAEAAAAPPVEACDSRCCNEMWAFIGWYFAAVAVCAILAALTGYVGLILLVFAPGAVVWGFAERWHGRVVTRCTMWEVVGEAAGILIVPLMVAIAFIDAAMPFRQTCDARRSIPFWRYFFVAYVRAGLLEESLKFFAVRRILRKSYVRDCRALLVYGALAGCAFGVLENLLYAFSMAPAGSVVRALLTVPLHTSTGVAIGCSLAEYRFRPDGVYGVDAPGRGWVGGFGVGVRTFAASVYGPVLAHGTYDVLLFIAQGECGPYYALIAVAVVCILPYYAYVRYRVASVETAFPPTSEDLHELIASGAVSKPCGCLECMACCY